MERLIDNKLSVELPIIFFRQFGNVRYFFLHVVCCYFFQWSITPLVDNYHNDHHYYIIKVFTGMRHGAGTRSNIGFSLFGERRDTGARSLYDGVRKVGRELLTRLTICSLCILTVCNFSCFSFWF